jgi:hypothetical protein
MSPLATFHFSSLFSFGLHMKMPQVYSNTAKYAKSIPISGSASDKSDCRFDRSIIMVAILPKLNPCNSKNITELMGFGGGGLSGLG